MFTSKEFLDKLTPNQRVKLDKKVIAIRKLQYGNQFVEKGIQGNIFDFSTSSQAVFIRWSNGVCGLGLEGEDFTFIEYRDSVKYILDNLLFSIVKADDAPCSSYTHLACAVDALYKMASDYKPFDSKVKEELENALEHMRLLHK